MEFFQISSTIKRHRWHILLSDHKSVFCSGKLFQLQLLLCGNKIWVNNLVKRNFMHYICNLSSFSKNNTWHRSFKQTLCDILAFSCTRKLFYSLKCFHKPWQCLFFVIFQSFKWLQSFIDPSTQKQQRTISWSTMAIHIKWSLKLH